MKINLEPPYSEDWESGYLQVNRENRRHIYLYNSKTDTEPAKRTTTQYARYLLAVKLGRYLTNKETADHIDGDKTNDSIANLQALSLRDNIRKTSSGIRVTEHGTLSMYRYCKCDLCRKAHSEHCKDYNRKRKESLQTQKSLLQ